MAEIRADQLVPGDKIQLEILDVHHWGGDSLVVTFKTPKGRVMVEELYQDKIVYVRD